MFIYIAIFILSSIFSYLYTISKDSSASFCFLVLCFLSIFLPAAFRYGIGADYFNYLTIYDQIALNKPIRQEIAILIYSKILLFFNLPGHALIVFYAFITYLFIFLAIPKKLFYLGIPIYILIFYLDSFCLLRQSLACAIMLYALRYFIKKNYSLFLLLSFFSILNHKVMIIVLFIILFSQLLPTFGKGFLITSFLFLFIFLKLYLTKIIDIIMTNIVPLTMFARYAMNRYAVAEAESNTGMGFLLRIIILLLFLIIIYTPDKKRYRFGIMAIFYNFFSLFLSQKLYIFIRLVNSFSFNYVYLAFFSIASVNRVSKKILSFIFISLFLLFVVGIKNTPVKFGRAGFGGKQIYPYVSIFDKYANYAILVKEVNYLSK